MSVDVVISPFNNARIMVGDDLSIESVNEQIEKERSETAAAKVAYDEWLAEAKTIQSGANDAAILATARQNLEAARQLKPPVDNADGEIQSRWKDWADRIYQETKTFTSCREVLHYAQSKIPFDHRSVVKPDVSEFDKYACLLNNEFPQWYHLLHLVSENPASIPETVYLLWGKHLVSNVFFWQLRNMFFCQTHVDPLNSIIEIGGGYGALARLWLNNPEAKVERYVIVDLPEALFFSEVCLKAEFGDQVGYWHGQDPKTKVVLVPVSRIDEYTKPSDLVISIGSMQEMSDAWISHYMGWLDRYNAKFFYSLNYMGASIEHLFESRNFWAPRPSHYWSTRVLHPDVPLIKTMCEGRSFVEVLYEKIKSQAKFASWSVLNGGFFDRGAYLEGLELLRQDCTEINAKVFINMVMQNVIARKFLLPKEVFSVASAIKSQDPQLKKFIKYLDEMKKQATY